MARRRNSDAYFRSLHRRVAAGEYDLIPALAREWERAGGGASHPAIAEVARTFENLERNGDHHDAPADILELFRDMESYTECDENAAVNRDVGYLDGAADALGMTIAELWEESERVRGGAGARRREREDEEREDEAPQQQGAFSHVYAETRCPGCNADLTAEDAVTMTVQPGNGRVLTRLDVQGELQDEGDAIIRGMHAGSECSSCGGSLNEMEMT